MTLASVGSGCRAVGKVVVIALPLMTVAPVSGELMILNSTSSEVINNGVSMASSLTLAASVTHVSSVLCYSKYSCNLAINTALLLALCNPRANNCLFNCATVRKSGGPGSVAIDNGASVTLHLQRWYQSTVDE